MRKVGQIKTITPINSNTNYCIEMKLIPINMDYCLLQIDALKVFLGDVSKWEVPTQLPKLKFFKVNAPISQQKPKVHYSN